MSLPTIRHKLIFFIAFSSFIGFSSVEAFQGQPATLAVSGGLDTGGVPQALLFSWNSAIPVAGSGWRPGETVSILLHGPLNSLGVVGDDLTVGTFVADSSGGFSGAATIPYDNGIIGPSARIPRPGLYEVRASAASSTTGAVAPDR